MDLFGSWTSLPNLHAALVHFPIALLPTAVFFDLAGLLVRGHERWLARSATVLYAAAAVAAGAAYWAGRQAADGLADVPARVLPAIGRHSDWGLYTLWAVGILALLRVAVALRHREGGRSAVRWILVVAGLLVVGMVGRTADLGGALVFRHGVAVAGHGAGASQGNAAGPDAGGEAAVPPGTPSAAAGNGGEADGPAATAERWLQADDGSWTWSPRPGDRGALGSLLTAAKGSSADAVTWLQPGSSGGEGVGLEVDGESLLVLPETFGDAEVEARLAVADFSGRLGLAHNVRGVSETGLFTVELPEGRFVLSRRTGGDGVETLGEEVHAVAAEELRLAVSAAGRHLRGTMNGDLVAHGHGPALPAGQVGLIFEGRGTVRVLEVTVTPLDGH